jgi:hypothetical protein
VISDNLFTPPKENEGEEEYQPKQETLHNLQAAPFIWEDETAEAFIPIAPTRKPQVTRQSRPSNILNEDNFDFAIALKPVKSKTSLVAVGESKIRADDEKQSTIFAAVLSRLRTACLEAKRFRSIDGKQVIVKLRAPEWKLEEAAEKMAMKMRQTDGTWSAFKEAHHRSFPVRGNNSLFLSSERQAIIEWLITSKIRDGGAELGGDDALAQAAQQRFPLHMYARQVGRPLHPLCILLTPFIAHPV